MPPRQLRDRPAAAHAGRGTSPTSWAARRAGVRAERTFPRARFPLCGMVRSSSACRPRCGSRRRSSACSRRRVPVEVRAAAGGGGAPTGRAVIRLSSKRRSNSAATRVGSGIHVFAIHPQHHGGTEVPAARQHHAMMFWRWTSARALRSVVIARGGQRLHQLGGGARVQTEAVDDGQVALDHGMALMAVGGGMVMSCVIGDGPRCARRRRRPPAIRRGRGRRSSSPAAASAGSARTPGAPGCRAGEAGGDVAGRGAVQVGQHQHALAAVDPAQRGAGPRQGVDVAVERHLEASDASGSLRSRRVATASNALPMPSWVTSGMPTDMPAKVNRRVRRCGSAAGQFAVVHGHFRPAGFAAVPGQAFGQVHGTMAAAAAAEGDGHVAAGFRTQLGQPGVEEALHRHVGRDFRLRLQVVADAGIAAGQRPQARIPKCGLGSTRASNTKSASGGSPRR